MSRGMDTYAFTCPFKLDTPKMIVLVIHVDVNILIGHA